MPDDMQAVGAPAAEPSLLGLLAAHSDQVLLIGTFGGMLLVMMVEALWPRRPSDDVPVVRWINNWALAALNYFLVIALSVAVSGSLWLKSITPNEGLLGGVHPVLAFLSLLLIVELIAYLTHRAFHAVPFLWRLHAVHHSDVEMDATTSHRHHSFEVLALAVVIMPAFLWLGAAPEIVMAFLLLRLAVVLVSHGNLRLPASVDRVLGWLIVTPDFHRVHHSSARHQTDSNFGTITPWFDYLFGTARRVSAGQQSQIETGLEYLRRAGDSRLDRLLLLPAMWKRWTGVRHSPVNG